MPNSSLTPRCWAERKDLGVDSDRGRPNRTAPPLAREDSVLGPFLISLGIFHPSAEALKFILKEDFTPRACAQIYFSLAPAIAMIPALMDRRRDSRSARTSARRDGHGKT